MKENNTNIVDLDPVKRSTQSRAYMVASGIWKERALLPVTIDNDGREIDGTKSMIIPLANGGYIELGRIESDSPGKETIYIEIKRLNVNGNKFLECGTNLTSGYYGDELSKDFGFWIFYENPHDQSQTGAIKYLAGFNPVIKVDWNQIKPRSNEMTVALSISQAYFESQKNHSSKGKNY